MSIDGHLADERAQDLAGGSPTAPEAGHLAGCASCRGRVLRYRELDRALSALPAPPPPGIAAAVLARIERRRLAREALALGGALLAVGLAAGALSLRLWRPAPADVAPLFAGAAALLRVIGALAPAVVPLQAVAGAAAAALAVPALLALRGGPRPPGRPAAWKGA